MSIERAKKQERERQLRAKNVEICARELKDVARRLTNILSFDYAKVAVATMDGMDEMELTSLQDVCKLILDPERAKDALS